MSVNSQNTKLDAGRFGDFHNAYHERLLNSMTSVVGDREAAEEITAAAFTKALEHLATFRGEASFYTWLHAIASNEARHYWKANRDVSLESITGPTPAALIEGDSAKDQEQSADRRRLQEALRRIPSHYRRLLEYHLRSRLFDPTDRPEGTGPPRDRVQPHLHGEEPLAPGLGGLPMKTTYSPGAPRAPSFGRFGHVENRILTEYSES
jgi:RNA polymerase sigma factor (sigma-70 family)